MKKKNRWREKQKTREKLWAGYKFNAMRRRKKGEITSEDNQRGEENWGETRGDKQGENQTVRENKEMTRRRAMMADKIILAHLMLWNMYDGPSLSSLSPPQRPPSPSGGMTLRGRRTDSRVPMISIWIKCHFIVDMRCRRRSFNHRLLTIVSRNISLCQSKSTSACPTLRLNVSNRKNPPQSVPTNVPSVHLCCHASR